MLSIVIGAIDRDSMVYSGRHYHHLHPTIQSEYPVTTILPSLGARLRGCFEKYVDAIIDLLIPGQTPGIKELLVNLYGKPELLFFGPDGTIFFLYKNRTLCEHHAMGGFVNGSITIPISTVHTKISNTVVAYITTASPSPSATGSSPCISPPASAAPNSTPSVRRLPSAALGQAPRSPASSSACPTRTATTTGHL